MVGISHLQGTQHDELLQVPPKKSQGAHREPGHLVYASQSASVAQMVLPLRQTPRSEQKQSGTPTQAHCPPWGEVPQDVGEN